MREPPSPEAARAPGDPPTLRDRIVERVRTLRAKALLIELRVAPTESQRLFALTLAIGVVCGFAAVLFHYAILVTERMFFDRALHAPGRSFVFWCIFTPTAGGLLCGALLEFVVPQARGSGIPQVKVAYSTPVGIVRLRDAIGKFFVGAVQIGTGSSLGREGPTVQICAGIACALGRFARLSVQNRHRLIPVGAAAGIAAAFNAPLAAVTFTIEEVVGNLDQTVLSGVIVAAALAAVIEHSALGAHPVLDVPHPFGFSDARSLLLYAALGVAAAVASVVFTDSLLALRERFRRLTLVPAWTKPGIGGALVGGLAAAAMGLLGTGGVNGGGYPELRQALTGSLPVRVMLALVVLKLAATVLSYASGGAGGIFAPILFIGAMMGGAFGSLDRTVFQHSEDAIGAFALVGMGAVFSATIRAPMTSVLIIVELTSGYGLILPLMIANMSAWVLARHFRPVPIYEALLAQDGVHLAERTALPPGLEDLSMSSLVTARDLWKSFDRTSPGSALVEAARDTRQSIFPVVDGAERLVGLVTQEELSLLESDPSLRLLVNAAEIMRRPVGVRPGVDARAAFDLMHRENLDVLPVLDSEDRIIGFIDEVAIARAYLRDLAPEKAG